MFKSGKGRFLEIFCLDDWVSRSDLDQNQNFWCFIMDSIIFVKAILHKHFLSNTLAQSTHNHDGIVFLFASENGVSKANVSVNFSICTLHEFNFCFAWKIWFFAILRNSDQLNSSIWCVISYRLHVTNKWGKFWGKFELKLGCIVYRFGAIFYFSCIYFSFLLLFFSWMGFLKKLYRLL